MYNDITGIILSGGKSERMGMNKSLLKFGNKTVIERVSELMRSLFKKVILITNEPELYKNLHLDTYTDILRGNGPISGIHSGLVHSSTEKNFILSCDMPFINVETIKFIVDYNSLNDIIVAEAEGFIQQLCGVYKKCLIGKIEMNIMESREKEVSNNEQHKRKCRVLRLIEENLSTVINIEDEFQSYHKDLFINMNTPHDYEYSLHHLQNILIDN